jgi:hypothetical protein
MSQSNVTFLIGIMQLCRQLLLQFVQFDVYANSFFLLPTVLLLLRHLHLCDCSFNILAVATCEMCHVCFRGWFLLLTEFCFRGLSVMLKIPIVWDVKQCCVTY